MSQPVRPSGQVRPAERLHPEGHGPDALTQREWDVIVLGAGSTGENVASRAHAGGLSVVVVEAELVGGDCSYWACMPSKALLRSPEAVDDARSVDGARQAVTGKLAVDAVLERRTSFTSGWSDASQVEWLEGAGIALVRGQGRLTGPRQVEVASRDGSSATLRAAHAVAVCVGTEATLPPVDGLAEVTPWTPRDATSASQVPARLAVLGGGVVGAEMATAWSALGSSVTVLEVGDRLLSRNEPEVGPLVQQALAAQGVDVRTGVTVTSVRRDGDGRSARGEITLTLEDGSTVSCDELLVAAGRAPKTADIGLDSVGLEPGAMLEVDDTLCVQGVEGGWLYAAGDCTGRAMLTHMGKYQARACGDVIAARARGEAEDPAPWSRYTATADHSAVPQVAFTDPQVASVGLTETQARDAGIDVRAVDYDLGQVAGAVLYADGYAGWAKLVVDESRQVVVGATFVGPAVGELVHAATVAIVGEVPMSRLWHAVPSYPTISEVWLRLLETYGR